METAATRASPAISDTRPIRSPPSWIPCPPPSAAVWRRREGASAKDRIHAPCAAARRGSSPASDDTRYDRYLRQVSVFDADQRRELYDPEFRRELGNAAGADEVILGPWREASGADLLDQLLETDATVYLPGDLLTKIDVATMAYSLEARSPLLDHEFMEFAASLPTRCKARGTRRKVALKNALRGWVPDAVLDGRKQGFELPVARWLRTDLAPFMREVLLDPGAERGWVRREEVAGLIDQHVTGNANHGRKLWSLLALELWAQAPVRTEAVDVLAA